MRYRNGEIEELDPQAQQEGAEWENSGQKVEDASADSLSLENESTGEGSPETAFTLEAELKEAKTQADDYYNRLQRLQAEFDNFRKRTLKEKEELVKYASERVVGELLPVIDNFERALEAAKNSQDFAALAQGVEMIFRQLNGVLGKEGLAEIEAVGQAFDPNLHEAIMQVDSEEHPANTVVEEVQKGYYLKDKVLRPSMVKVSS
ncbi:nucleotide exchange factor GrpE [Paradesulfitobacterium aromaticivorans]